MNYYSTQITNLIEELRHLPGIGSKSAQRLAFHIINMPEEHVEHLAQVLVEARKKIRYCKYCCTLTDAEVCPICASSKRVHSTIMVVEHTQDLAAYEKTGQFFFRTVAERFGTPVEIVVYISLYILLCALFHAVLRKTAGHTLSD